MVFWPGSRVQGLWCVIRRVGGRGVFPEFQPCEPGKDSRRVQVSLVLVVKDEKQKEIKLSKPRTIIGRQTECTIRIPVPAVSRQHCELILDEGEVTLRDLNSGNGTYVNRKRIKEVVLSPGDLVAVGPAVFVVRMDGKPANVSAEDALKAGSAPEPASEAPSQVAKSAGAKPTTAPAASAAASNKAAAAPSKPNAPVSNDPDDSSMSDFDFLDDEDDDQPKL